MPVSTDGFGWAVIGAVDGSHVVMLVSDVLLLTAGVYVEVPRRSYRPHVQILGGLSFAGGAASIALAVLG